MTAAERGRADRLRAMARNDNGRAIRDTTDYYGRRDMKAAQVCQNDRVLVDLDGRLMSPLAEGVVLAKVERGKWLVRLEDGRQVKVWAEDIRRVVSTGKGQ